MVISNSNNYQTSFGAHIVRNKALFLAYKEIKAMYGKAYIKKVSNQLKKIGTDEDKIEFKYSTWHYTKDKYGKLVKEPISFVTLNKKHIGHFENRFCSNCIAKLKEKSNFFNKNRVFLYETTSHKKQDNVACQEKNFLILVKEWCNKIKKIFSHSAENT